MPLTAETEPLLVARAQRGEVAAFEELIELYAADLYQLLRRLLGAAADPVASSRETFLAAWRALPGYGGETRFAPWLYRIALSEANGWPPSDTDREHPDFDAAPVLSGAPALDFLDSQAYVERCVAELPADFRAAVVLRDIHGLSNEEAATVLGVDLNRFKDRLHQARMSIRGRVERLELGAAGRRVAEAAHS